MLANKSILITGGTGSFGQAFIRRVLAEHPEVGRIVIFSRDELKQFEMQQVFSPEEHSRTCAIFWVTCAMPTGLRRALEGIDIVIHAAALKQVPAAEYNPVRMYQDQCARSAEPDRGLPRYPGETGRCALSTDKAAAPINLYGATKLCSDKLFTSMNNISGQARAACIGGALRQRHGEPRLGHSVLPRRGAVRGRTADY